MVIWYVYKANNLLAKNRIENFSSENSLTRHFPYDMWTLCMWVLLVWECLVKSFHETLVFANMPKKIRRKCADTCLKKLDENHIFVPTISGNFHFDSYILFSPFLVPI